MQIDFDKLVGGDLMVALIIPVNEKPLSSKLVSIHYPSRGTCR